MYIYFIQHLYTNKFKISTFSLLRFITASQNKACDIIYPVSELTHSSKQLSTSAPNNSSDSWKTHPSSGTEKNFEKRRINKKEKWDFWGVFLLENFGSWKRFELIKLKVQLCLKQGKSLVWSFFFDSRLKYNQEIEDISGPRNISKTWGFLSWLVHRDPGIMAY